VNRRSYKGIGNPSYIDGRTLKKYYCKCGKELNVNTVLYGTNQCHSCFLKSGKANLKDGRSLKIYYCKDCNKELEGYRAIRCQSCETKRRYILGLLSPEKTLPEIHLEKILNKLYNKQYRFVGNGKYWITNFNPDFVDIKNKRIIEMFGDYWHNREEIIKRDKIRIKTYQKYGYSTLIIWEHELKNQNNLILKLRRFLCEK
jgi:G:T-mismatch repair DNA endonuclease (very short patch repair protein)